MWTVRADSREMRASTSGSVVDSTLNGSMPTSLGAEAFVKWLWYILPCDLVCHNICDALEQGSRCSASARAMSGEWSGDIASS